MRPRIEGIEERRVIDLIENHYHSLSPTQLIEQLINNHYESIYPRGEGSDNAKTEESTAHKV